MYAGVPNSAPPSVPSFTIVVAEETATSVVAPLTANASPKSSTFTRPSRVILMLAGFKSRCTIPRTAEESQFGNATLARIERGEPIQRGVKIEQVDLIRRECGVIRVTQRHASPASRALRSQAGTRVIDENAAHHLRDHRQELCPVLPVGIPLIDETEIRLVHEGGRLQGVSCAFAPELCSGTPPQLAIHERHRPIAGVQIAPGPGTQETRDVVMCIGPGALAGRFWIDNRGIVKFLDDNWR